MKDHNSSRMFLPLIKVVWLGIITLLAMGVTLSINNLGKILKSTFRRHIGLYCLIVLTSLTFGTRVMAPKFSLLQLKSNTILIISPLMCFHIFLKQITVKPFGPEADPVFIPDTANSNSLSVKGPCSRTLSSSSSFSPSSQNP
jgi:hypothetical protein